MAEVRRVARMTLDVTSLTRAAHKARSIGGDGYTPVHPVAECRRQLTPPIARKIHKWILRRAFLSPTFAECAVERFGSPTLQVQGHLGCGAVRLWRVAEVTPFW